MVILGIDTTALAASAAVLRDGVIVSECYLNAGLTHSQTLMELIDAALKLAGIGMKDVEYYLANFPAPLFCFSPDANFPLCNGEKGIYHGRAVAAERCENIVDFHAGGAGQLRRCV